LEIRRNFTKDYETRKQEIQNQTLKITTVIEPPYVMWGKNGSLKNCYYSIEFLVILAPNGSNSSHKFVGFCIDILLDLSERLNFSFEIEIVKDATFGKKNEKGEWNGIIGELVNRVCHFIFLDKII
jgi:hypothetical protein